MSIYTKSGFARYVGIKASQVSRAIKEKKLIENQYNQIDTSNRVNKIFIDFYLQKQKREQINEPKVKKPIKSENNKDFEGDNLAEKKIKAEILYKETQISLNKIKEEKYSGILIPTDAVKNLFSYAVENVRALLLQELHTIAEIYQQRMELSNDDFVAMQKDLSLRVAEIMKIYKSQLSKGVEGIVDVYQEVRNRGDIK